MKEFNREEEPSEKVFNDIKSTATELWVERYSDTINYLPEKIERVKSITNLRDNVWVIFRMFDIINQHLFLKKLSLIEW